MIIGITGTLGAGKGTIVDYLVNNRGFKHYSVRGFLTAELEKMNHLVNRDTMTDLANTLRAENTPSYIIEQLYKQAEAAGGDSIIESIRAVGEVAALKEKPDFYLFAIDCDIKQRYNRIQKRMSSTDNVTFEVFEESELREMSSEDPNKQNLSKCISMSDYVFQNDGSIETLHNKIEKVLSSIKN
ncbi:MAG: AAA family ATPase [Spirochaetes bacterium]|nr:AAA family ATPase [Spirochaetota bacterium]